MKRLHKLIFDLSQPNREWGDVHLILFVDSFLIAKKWFFSIADEKAILKQNSFLEINNLTIFYPYKGYLRQIEDYATKKRGAVALVLYEGRNYIDVLFLQYLFYLHIKNKYFCFISLLSTVLVDIINFQFVFDKRFF